MLVGQQLRIKPIGLFMRLHPLHPSAKIEVDVCNIVQSMVSIVDWCTK
jgi:hypothetical protein